MKLNSWPMTLAVAFALGCDAMAVGLAVGTTAPPPRAVFRLWFHFGLFQFLMTVLGFNLGANTFEFVKAINHWVSFVLLFVIASKMLYESRCCRDEDAENPCCDPTRGWSLVVLSISTSLDALGIGFGMGLTDSKLLEPALCIGFVAALMTFIGIRLGKKLTRAFGHQAETVGAVVLYLVALLQLLL